MKIIDYLSKEQTLDPFYSKSLSTNNLKIQAKKKIKAFSGLNRKILVKNLKTQYKNVQISSAVKKNLDLLSKKNSVTVTTGHQLSLMTGPLYFIIKIICNSFNFFFSCNICYIF